MKVENQFLKKSIATQTGSFEYMLSFAANNTSGQINFGFSGEDRVLDFDIKSGKIFDYQDNFVYGISPYETVTLSGRCDTGNHNYYINDAPLNLNSQKESGWVDWFYVNAQNCEVDIDFYVNGERPIYNFSNLSFEGRNITGYGIIENVSGFGKKFRVFSGDFYTGDYKFFSFPTGDITGSEQYSAVKIVSGTLPTITGEVLNDVGFKLYTNFGVIDSSFQVSTVNLYVQTLELEGPSYIQNTGTITLYLNYQNLLGGIDVVGVSGFPLDITFKNISGAGQSGSGIVTGLYTGNPFQLTGSGFIRGSGRLTGSFSDLIATGYDNYLSVNVSGYISGEAQSSSYFYSTGSFTENISVTGTGFGTGTYYGLINGSGIDIGPSLMSGVLIGSGYLYGNTGSISEASGILDGNVLYGSIESGQRISFQYITGNYSFNSGIFCSGWVTGINFEESFILGDFSGYINEYVPSGNKQIQLLITGDFTGGWLNDPYNNNYNGYSSIIDYDLYYTGETTGIFNVDGIAKWTGDQPIFQGFLHSNYVTGFSNETFVFDLDNIHTPPMTITGSGFFDGYFQGFQSGATKFISGIAKNLYQTGLFYLSGFYTGNATDSVTGYLTGYVTGIGYSGIGVSYSTGREETQFFEVRDTGIKFFRYSHSPDHYIKLTGYGQSTGEAIKISGNSGECLACNIGNPDITGQFPPNLVTTDRYRQIWFEWDAIGGDGSSDSVTFEVENYVGLTYTGYEPNYNQDRANPYMYLYSGGSGSTGLHYLGLDDDSGPGLNPREFISNVISGTKYYILICLNDSYRNIEGVFRLTWRDGYRNTSFSTSYYLDNPVKQYNEFYHDDSIINIGDFTGESWIPTTGTGEVNGVQYTNQFTDPRFKYFSGILDDQYIRGNASIGTTVSDSIIPEDFGQKVININQTGLISNTDNFSLVDPIIYNGYTEDTLAYSLFDYTYYNFEIRIRTGNVNYSDGEDTRYLLLNGKSYTNFSDFGTINQLTDLINNDFQQYNIVCSNDGVNLYITGYNMPNIDLHFRVPDTSTIQNANNNYTYSYLDAADPIYIDTSGLGEGIVTLTGSGIMNGIIFGFDEGLNLTGLSGQSLGTGLATVSINGNILDGSGTAIINYINNSLTPYIFSASGTSGNFISFSDFSGNIDSFFYTHTGYIEQNLSNILVSGSIQNPTGNILSTGIFEIEKSFDILSGSGHYLFSGTGYETGQPLSSYSIYDGSGVSGVTPFTGTLRTLYSPIKYVENVISENLSGFFYQNYLKTFTGEWNIITGTSLGSDQVDFFAEYFYDSGISGYNNIDQNYLITGSDSIRISIQRKKNIGFDLHQLEISGYQTGLILQISGGQI